MSTLQRDELMTQSQILEKETSSPPAKRRISIAKQSPAKRNMVTIHNRTVACYVIEFTVGWSYGEQQGCSFPYLGANGGYKRNFDGCSIR
jgi:hypothetical protein